MVPVTSEQLNQSTLLFYLNYVHIIVFDFTTYHRPGDGSGRRKSDQDRAQGAVMNWSLQREGKVSTWKEASEER
jgi:hypothetical protein